MFENIIVSVVSGLITTAILEGVKKVRAGTGLAVVETPPSDPTPSPAPAPVTVPAPAPARMTRAGFWVRLFLSPLIGFFLGALTAGFIEAGGKEAIVFGSLPANLLIVVWTIVVWLFLSRRRAK